MSVSTRFEKVQRGRGNLALHRHALPRRGMCRQPNCSRVTKPRQVHLEITAPGAYIYVADAALVTEDNLAALGDTLFIPRLPATYNECGRLIAEAVAHNTWEDVGVLAHTKPSKQRPVTSYKAYEGEVTLYGAAYRAVVVHSSAQDKRRQQRLARDLQASSSTMQATVRPAEQQEYFCRADAEAAAARLRA